jgi:hypothetical protein
MVPKMTNKIFAKIILIFAFAASLFLGACYYDNEHDLYQFVNQPCDTTTVKFSTSVSPILQTSCNSCHSSQSPSGNVISDSYNGVKTIADDKRLWGTITHQTGYSQMPKGGNKLSDCNLAKIRIWIAAGAPNN